MTVSITNTYEPLTLETALQLAKDKEFFSADAKLSCREIGDGNLNLVFHITDLNGEGIIIKQALPYAKVVGESWPLTIKRATIEAEALKIFKQVAPNYVPEVYYANEELAITIMEDLSHLTIARKGLIDGAHYPLLAEHLGEYLAHTIFFTSDFGLSKADKKKLVGRFLNPELCKITEDLIFADPYYDAKTNEYEEALKEDVQQLWGDNELKLQVALLRKSFLTETEALLHGDLHTGSVFVSETETKVIDPEFAYYGPVGFDVGQVMANLLFQALANKEKAPAVVSQLISFWNTFVDHYTFLWEQSNTEPFANINGLLEITLQKYFQDGLGFAGCELIRRTIGLAHVADLDTIADEKQRIKAKKQSITLGRRLILERRTLTTLSDILM